MVKATKPTNDCVNIGDIYCCTWGYSMRLPFWGKIIAKNGKTMVTVQPLKERILYGHHNGQWASMPMDVSDEGYKSAPYKTCLYIGYDNDACVKTPYGTLAHKWDGKSHLSCDDMD